MKAFRGFLITGFLGSFCCLTSCFLKAQRITRFHFENMEVRTWISVSNIHTYKYMPLSYCSCSCLPVGGTMAGWGIPVGCMPDGPSIRG